MKRCNRQYARPAVGREAKANESLGPIVIHLDVRSEFRLFDSSWTDRLFTSGGTTNDSETLQPRNSNRRVRGWSQLPSSATQFMGKRFRRIKYRSGRLRDGRLRQLDWRDRPDLQLVDLWRSGGTELRRVAQRTVHDRPHVDSRKRRQNPYRRDHSDPRRLWLVSAVIRCRRQRRHRLYVLGRLQLFAISGDRRCKPENACVDGSSGNASDASRFDESHEDRFPSRRRQQRRIQ